MSRAQRFARPKRPEIGNVSSALAKDRLGAPAVMIFAAAAATPITVVAGVVTTGFAVTGIIALPVAFAAIGLVLAVFSVGYVSMAKHVANTGGMYAYIARGIGRPLGVGSAWVALAAYNALQVGLYGIIDDPAAPLLQEWFGVEVPWWVVALCVWLIVAVLGLQNVRLNRTVLAVLLIAEVVLILVFSVTGLIHPAGDAITFDTLNPVGLATPGVGAILAIGVLGFVGFESTLQYSEEARDPRRTIRIATYATVATMAVLYALSSWAMSEATGPDQIVAASQEQGPELIFNLAGSHLGATAIDIGHALFVTSVLAAMISFHNIAARYAFSLGRERVFPEILGRTSARTGAPKVGSLTQSAIGFVVIVVYAVGSENAGWNPVEHLFYWGGAIGGLGVLALITTTSLAIILFFRRHPGQEALWRRLIAPVLAALALTVVVWLVVKHFPTLLGVEPSHPLRWGVPIGFVVIAVLGMLWAWWVRHHRPDAYEAIGFGAKPATADDTAFSTSDAVPDKPDFEWTGDPT